MHAKIKVSTNNVQGYNAMLKTSWSKCNVHNGNVECKTPMQEKLNNLITKQ